MISRNILLAFTIGVAQCLGVSASAATPSATAAAYGLPRDEALKSITLNAARVLGVEDRLGSLEEGKEATLIVTTGDPLEITTQVERAFVQSVEIDLDDRHKRLRDKYQARIDAMGK